VDTFEQYRPLLFSIAYRMLGSAMEAEDMVQETYLRFLTVPEEQVKSQKALLTTIITRLCLDQMKSARAQREMYVGEWLPEPVLTESVPMWTKQTGEDDTISMAFLVLLESLSPLERAVFLLREVFEYEYSEIAQIVEREEAACRQIFHRARTHISAHRPRFHTTPEAQQEITVRFLKACAEGDLDGLMALLAEDVTSWSDGGGKVFAARKPIHGRDKVARFIMGLLKHAPPGIEVEVKVINGKPGIITRYEGKAVSVLNFEVDGGVIREMRAVANPDKLVGI
jgi:RNA polymerase sigma-70 factor, ECF subfamily